MGQLRQIAEQIGQAIYSQIINHKVLSPLTKDTLKQMVYTFQTVAWQAHLGPGPSSMIFLKGESDYRITLTPLYPHLDESALKGVPGKLTNIFIKILLWNLP